DQTGYRKNYLYETVLTHPGRLPSGHITKSYFLSTVNQPGYMSWMEEETRFYARRYGHTSNLLGFNLGPFSEPFASQRGGFLRFDDATQHYEITQYTPQAALFWREWLVKNFGSLDSINAAYKTSFSRLEDIPLPLNEHDARFNRSDVAYFDFVRS